MIPTGSGSAVNAQKSGACSRAMRATLNPKKFGYKWRWYGKL